MPSDITDELTETVYEFLREYLAAHGYAPSQREIADACFISQTAVTRYLDRLRAARRIWSAPGKPRSIRLLNPPLRSLSSDGRSNGRSDGSH